MYIYIYRASEEALPQENKYHKIFNLNSLKLNYCCATNVGNVIKQHNTKVLSKAMTNTAKNVIADQNQTALCMVSVPLSV